MNGAKTKHAKRFLKTILLLSLLLLPISTTGCSHYVVVPGGETIQINVQQWDQMRQDNELLIITLKECQGKK